MDPPAVKIPPNDAGKPSSSTSQRIAIVSRRFPGVTHQRCGEATVWARSAAVAMVDGPVVTHPLNPGWPTRRPLGMRTSRISASTASRPAPSRGRGRSRRGYQAERCAAGSGPSKRRKLSRAGSSASMDAVRSSVDAGSGPGPFCRIRGVSGARGDRSSPRGAPVRRAALSCFAERSAAAAWRVAAASREEAARRDATVGRRRRRAGPAVVPWRPPGDRPGRSRGRSAPGTPDRCQGPPRGSRAHAEGTGVSHPPRRTSTRSSPC